MSQIEPTAAADMNSLLMRPLELPAGFFPFSSRLVTGAGERLTADDRLDLMSMLNRFDWSLLSARDDDLMGLMTDDVVVDHGFGYAEGREAGLALIKQIPSLGLRHHFTNHVVFVDAEGAPSVAAYKFRRVGNSWRFSRRVFEQLKFGDYLGDTPERAAFMAETSEQRHARLTTAT